MGRKTFSLETNAIVIQEAMRVFQGHTIWWVNLMWQTLRQHSVSVDHRMGVLRSNSTKYLKWFGDSIMNDNLLSLRIFTSVSCSLVWWRLEHEEGISRIMQYNQISLKSTKSHFDYLHSSSNRIIIVVKILKSYFIYGFLIIW